MESQSHAFIAGLFVILLGLGMLAGAVWLENPGEPARLQIDLISTHSVAGLKVDAPVRFRGVDVGRVRSIAFDSRQADRIRVRIAVDRTAPITRATYAKVIGACKYSGNFPRTDSKSAKSNHAHPSKSLPLKTNFWAVRALCESWILSGREFRFLL